MTATWKHPHLSAGCISLVLLVGSCNAMFGVDDLSYRAATPGEGGSGGSGGSAGTGQGALGGEGGEGGSGSSGGQGGSAGAAGSGAPPPTCTEQYGAAQGFELCIEDATFCEFFVFANGASCNSVCAAYDGSCLATFNDTTGDNCVHNGSLSCQNSYNTVLCRCTRS